MLLHLSVFQFASAGCGLDHLTLLMAMFCSPYIYIYVCLYGAGYKYVENKAALSVTQHINKTELIMTFHSLTFLQVETIELS